MVPVSALRRQRITFHPIVYKLWFKEEVISVLLKKLSSEIDYKKLTFQGGYVLLYIGSGINGHDRLVKYHILDSGKFHETGVANGRLSSLRQTLCGLLDLPMSKSCAEVNTFIDQNCMVEWLEFPSSTKKQLHEAEKSIIKSHYLPLNWQHTSGVLTYKHRKILSACKKNMRV